MGTQQDPNGSAEADDSAASADDEAAADGGAEGAAAADGAAGEGAGDQADDQAAAGEGGEGEGGEKPGEPEKPAAKLVSDLSDDELRAIGLKFANKTMAAARRAERAVDSVKTENVKLREDVKVYGEWFAELRSTPLSALKRAGFETFRDFAAHVAANGGDAKPETPEDRIARLERTLGERDQREAARSTEAQVTELRTAVFEAIDGNKAEFARTATSHGKRELWDAVEQYAKMHRIPVHQVPDVAIGALAKETEKLLRAEFGEPASVNGSPGPGAKQGNTGAAPAARAPSTSGNGLAGKAQSGAPKTREYSMDPDERRKQVDADLRKEGLL